MKASVVTLAVVVVVAVGLANGQDRRPFPLPQPPPPPPPPSGQSMESTWTGGRIAQVTLAVIESALLTLVLVFPAVMDPVVSFINQHIGGAGSRRRREVQAVLTDHAAALHNLLLDAVDLFQDMDATLSNLSE